MFPRRPLFLDVAAGIASGAFFCMASAPVPAAMLLLYFPFLPLFLAGLARGARAILVAAITACLTVGLVTAEAGDALLCALFIAGPAWYFTRAALRVRETRAGRAWYPALRVLSELTAFGACFFMTALIAGSSGTGGAQASLAHAVRESLKGSDPKIAGLMSDITGQWLFLLPALAGWLWVLTLYGFAVLANALLERRGLALRPHLAISARDLPSWLLPLLPITGALAMLGHGADRFAAQTVFLLFLLPYFLGGLGWLHEASRKWRGRALWLTLYYAVLFFLGWPALLPMGAGLYVQVSELLDRRREMG